MDPAVTIDVIDDPATLGDDELAAALALVNRIDAARFPDDPPTALDRFVTHQRALPDRLVRRWVLARRPNGRVLGFASAAIDPDHDDNPTTLEPGLVVDLDARRRGIGRALARGLVEFAREHGRTRMFVNIWADATDGEAVMAAAGGVRRQAHHVNRLALADVDRSLLEGWVADAGTQAADYALVAYDGRCPDEHVDGAVSQILVLNDAPRDDVDMNDFTLTPSLFREMEERRAAAGLDQWTLLARHRRSGEYAGIHDITFRPDAPATVHVGLTGVPPAHRGHGIGRWLKAVMTLRLLDERPEIVDVRTGNADSNQAMLAINEAMGYRPFRAIGVWEIATDDAAAWVGP